MAEIDEDLPEHTLEDVAQHNRREDIWICIRGLVYNVTDYINEHPGGEEIMMQHAGKEATEAFIDIGHSKSAHNTLEEFLVGRLVDGQGRASGGATEPLEATHFSDTEPLEATHFSDTHFSDASEENTAVMADESNDNFVPGRPPTDELHELLRDSSILDPSFSEEAFVRSIALRFLGWREGTAPPLVWADHIDALREVRAQLELAMVLFLPDFKEDDMYLVRRALNNLEKARKETQTACGTLESSKQDIKAALRIRLEEDGLEGSVDIDQVISQVEATGKSPIDCYRRRLEEYAQVTLPALALRVDEARKGLTDAQCQVSVTVSNCLVAAFTDYCGFFDADNTAEEEVAASVFLCFRLLLGMPQALDLPAGKKLIAASACFEAAKNEHSWLLQKGCATFNTINSLGGFGAEQMSERDFAKRLESEAGKGEAASPYMLTFKQQWEESKTAMEAARAHVRECNAAYMKELMAPDRGPITHLLEWFLQAQCDHTLDSTLLHLMFCAHMLEIRIALQDLPAQEDMIIMMKAISTVWDFPVRYPAWLSGTEVKHHWLGTATGSLRGCWDAWKLVMSEGRLTVDARVEFLSAWCGQHRADYPILSHFRVAARTVRQGLAKATQKITAHYESLHWKIAPVLAGILTNKESPVPIPAVTVLYGDVSAWKPASLVAHLQRIIRELPAPNRRGKD